ncbi:hypothetical protein K491DRAFT_330834 [Lophiostoma macrostomum CBS 122681]|uniref:Uncharacterized protein n=1 Tax=Lophiostoma macrostomum CBS 122681 TaxID=1314788 RepID=A0A6A6TEC0_9PLEO|nr:hypothetical protein K491DRAFT_330834 [Lophiostoma macrostomum CBS 122681]
MLDLQLSLIFSFQVLVPLPMASELLKLAVLNATFRKCGCAHTYQDPKRFAPYSKGQSTSTRAFKERLGCGLDPRPAKKQKRDSGVDGDLEVELLPPHIGCEPHSLQRSTPDPFSTIRPTSAPWFPSPYQLRYRFQTISSLPVCPPR